MKKVKVELGPRSYEVVVKSGVLALAGSVIEPFAAGGHIVVIADQTVDRLHGDALEKNLEQLGKVDRINIEPGEQSKSWDKAGALLEKLATLEARRNSLIVTLGGGVVSDLGGFAAAAYQRGLPLVHVPSTLLGQVDAAIGGKTGVNLRAGKNLAGAFYQPSLVICDPDLLQTLPDRELRSGFAEVIKYGLCFDPSILDRLPPDLSRMQREDAEDLVFTCASIKAGVVGADEGDRSGRMVLNYGHTFGHALEACGNYRDFSHGEAIAVGMMFAAQVARSKGLITDEVLKAHSRALTSVGLPLRAAFDPGRIKPLWEMDKKNEGIQRWILLEGLARPAIHTDVTDDELDAAIEKVQ